MNAFICSLGPTLGTVVTLILGITTIIVIVILCAIICIRFQSTLHQCERALDQVFDWVAESRVSCFIGRFIIFVAIGLIGIWYVATIGDIAYRIWQGFCGG